jgi:hypothetical protein
MCDQDSRGGMLGDGNDTFHLVVLGRTLGRTQPLERILLGKGRRVGLTGIEMTLKILLLMMLVGSIAAGR